MRLLRRGRLAIYVRAHLRFGRERVHTAGGTPEEVPLVSREQLALMHTLGIVKPAFGGRMRQPRLIYTSIHVGPFEFRKAAR